MLNNIFSPFYYKDNITNNYDMKERLVPKMLSEYNKEKNNQPSGWNCKCFTSLDKDNNILREYGSTYNDIIMNFMATEGFKDNQVHLESMWYNIYGKGQWQESHTHNGPPPTPWFSCVHFLKYNPEIHKGITFMNPNRVSNMIFNLPYDTTTNYWNAKQTITDIQEGDVIIFPSNLEHEVPVQDSNELRITIAFNLVLQ